MKAYVLKLDKELLIHFTGKIEELLRLRNAIYEEEYVPSTDIPMEVVDYSNDYLLVDIWDFQRGINLDPQQVIDALVERMKKYKVEVFGVRV